MGGNVTYSLALGPFHPAWRGPPRFDLPQALHLVTRICGTCSFAHSLAFCQAIEQLCGIEVSERASALRCVAAEFERIASHVRAAAAVLRAIGMDAYAADLDGPRELVLQSLQ